MQSTQKKNLCIVSSENASNKKRPHLLCRSSGIYDSTDPILRTIFLPLIINHCFSAHDFSGVFRKKLAWAEKINLSKHNFPENRMQAKSTATPWNLFLKTVLKLERLMQPCLMSGSSEQSPFWWNTSAKIHPMYIWNTFETWPFDAALPLSISDEQSHFWWKISVTICCAHFLHPKHTSKSWLKKI